MKSVLPFLALSGIACLWLGCAGGGRPATTVPLRCEARPHSSTTGLGKVEIREPAVVIPSAIQSVKPEPVECSKLAELLQPDEACADPAGPVCAFLVHPTSGSGDSALPDGRFPVVLFSHGTTRRCICTRGSSSAWPTKASSSRRRAAPPTPAPPGTRWSGSSGSRPSWAGWSGRTPACSRETRWRRGWPGTSTWSGSASPATPAGRPSRCASWRSIRESRREWSPLRWRTTRDSARSLPSAPRRSPRRARAARGRRCPPTPWRSAATPRASSEEPTAPAPRPRPCRPAARRASRSGLRRWTARSSPTRSI